MVDLSQIEAKKITNTYKKFFKQLQDKVKFSDLNKPLERSHDKEFGVENPYSKAVCFLMYLYSMEVGDPTLYAELNKAVRSSDPAQVDTFGTIAMAMEVFMVFCEGKKKKDDHITTG